jgi:hypothetical protein
MAFQKMVEARVLEQVHLLLKEEEVQQQVETQLCTLCKEDLQKLEEARCAGEKPTNQRKDF